MGEWTYSCSLRLWPLYRGGKRPSVPTSQEAARGQKSIFKSGRKEKSLLPQQGFEIWFLRRPSRSLATIATSISRLVQEAARGQKSIFKSWRKEKPLLPQQGLELWFLRHPSRSLATIATSIPGFHTNLLLSSKSSCRVHNVLLSRTLYPVPAI